MFALQQLNSTEFNVISLGAGEEMQLERERRAFHGSSSSAASVFLLWRNNSQLQTLTHL